MRPSRPHITAGHVRAVAALAMFSLAGCGPLYGADFDYPSDLPVPPQGTVELHGDAADNDDPMRSRYQLLDVGDAGPDALTEFYAHEFPAFAGWTEWETTSGQTLCLVRKEDRKYTELVEVFPYLGTAVESREGMYLVMTSRLQWFDDDVCGAATRWVPMDLLPPESADTL